MSIGNSSDRCWLWLFADLRTHLSSVVRVELGQRQVDDMLSYLPKAVRAREDGRPNFPAAIEGFPVRVVEHPDYVAVVFRDGLEDGDVPRR